MHHPYTYSLRYTYTRQQQYIPYMHWYYTIPSSLSVFPQTRMYTTHVIHPSSMFAVIFYVVVWYCAWTVGMTCCFSGIWYALLITYYDNVCSYVVVVLLFVSLLVLLIVCILPVVSTLWLAMIVYDTWLCVYCR